MGDTATCKLQVACQ